MNQQNAEDMEKGFALGRKADESIKRVDKLRAEMKEEKQLKEPPVRDTKDYSSPSPSLSDTHRDDERETLPYRTLSKVPLKKVSFLIEDFLPEGYISALYGDGDQGKSFLTLYIAVSVACGREFLGRKATKGRVLYLDFELNESLQRERLEMICNGLNIKIDSIDDNLKYLSPGFNPDVPPKLSSLLPLLVNDEFDLLIIDSMGAALEGDPESAKDICKLFQEFRQLKTVLFLDHQSKKQRGEKGSQKTMFGSAYKYNLSRNVWHLNRVEQSDGVIESILTHKKCNLSLRQEPIGLKIVIDDSSYSVSECEPSHELSEHLNIKKRIIDCLEELEKATAEEIADELDEDVKTVRNKLTTLKKKDLVVKDGKKDKAAIYKLKDSSSQ